MLNFERIVLACYVIPHCIHCFVEISLRQIFKKGTAPELFK